MTSIDEVNKGMKLIEQINKFNDKLRMSFLNKEEHSESANLRQGSWSREILTIRGIPQWEKFC